METCSMAAVADNIRGDSMEAVVDNIRSTSERELERDLSL